MKYLTYYKIIIFSYSRCLVILDLLQFDFFRSQLDNPEFIKYLRNEIYVDWEKPEKTIEINETTKV